MKFFEKLAYEPSFAMWNTRLIFPSDLSAAEIKTFRENMCKVSVNQLVQVFVFCHLTAISQTLVFLPAGKNHNFGIFAQS